MKKLFFLIVIFLTTGAGIFLSCKKENSCEGCVNGNKPPIAIAGPDKVITLPTDSLTVDGSTSTDPDGTIVAYQWRKISGPQLFNISNAATAITTIKNLVAGSYEFELKVTDNGGLSTTDTMSVIVDLTTHHPPVANAGPDQTITLPANSVYLDGSASTDPDNNISGYLWSIISGPASYNITYPNAVQTQFGYLLQGVYLVELKVTDTGGLFSKDTVQVTVNPLIPPPPPCDNSSRPQINAQLVPIGTLSQARLGMAVASAGNKIFFAGASLTAGAGTPTYGSSRVDIYDVTTQVWTTAELSESREDIAAVASGNKVFFAGGRLGDGAFDELFSTVDIYDISTNTWSVANLSMPRAYISAAAVGNKVFFAGGEYNWNYNTTERVDIYDLSTNQWSIANLSEPRAYISAVTVNNKIYFAGGHVEDRWYTQPSNRIDIYDNASNSWSSSNLNQPMGFLAGTTSGSKIYWAAGCDVEIKDANSGTSSAAYLFKPGGWIIDEGQNAVVKDGKIIFLRHAENTDPTNRFDIYDIANNSWSIGILPIRVNSASIISVNNVIYLAGGSINGSTSNITNQVWKLEF